MTTYYLSPTGVDTNAGTATGTAWLTLGKAVNTCVGGDIVEVQSGTYNLSAGGRYFTGKNYSAASPLIIRGYNGAFPVFKTASAYEGIHFETSSYITLQNLVFEGDSDNITYANAYAARNNPSDPIYNVDGVIFRDCHHISLLQVTSRKYPANGFLLANCDYLTITGCTAADNAKYTSNGCQGLTVLNAYNYDSAVVVRTNITNCIAIRNISLIPWKAAGAITEGNGLMLDTTQESKTGAVAYTGKIYISGNFCSDNGGAGIQIYKANNVVVDRNYCYGNSQNLQYGELRVAYSANTKSTSNSLVPDSSSKYYLANRYNHTCQFVVNNVANTTVEDNVGSVSTTEAGTVFV